MSNEMNHVTPENIAKILESCATRKELSGTETFGLLAAAATEHKIANGEYVPAPVTCGMCKYKDKEDCPVVEYEFVTPWDKERTLFTAFPDSGFCAKGKRKDDK